MIEAIPAYSSLSIHYDIVSVKKKAGTLTAFEWIKKQVEERLEQSISMNAIHDRLVRIPVCYEKEFGMDLLRLAGAKNISVEEVVALHTANTYKVFMLGFLPGFAYMGEVNERIAMPRKPQPVNIAAGSVGIAGKQTGIYPLASPGGWQIMGRTPLKLFDSDKEEPTLFKAGDSVQFYSIDRDEYENTVSHGLH
jgi:inhibitor of KinA